MSRRTAAAGQPGRSAPPPRRMLKDALPLLVRLAACLLLAAAVIAVSATFGLRVSWPIPLALGLALGTVLWIVDRGADRAEQLHPPQLDLDADYALPHAQDMRVRRLEDAIYGAQPSRRMTARTLGQVLGEVADERDLDPDAPALSSNLSQLIERSRTPAAAERSVPAVSPIDRRTLHRYLHELAAREERDR